MTVKICLIAGLLSLSLNIFAQKEGLDKSSYIFRYSRKVELPKSIKSSIKLLLYKKDSLEIIAPLITKHGNYILDDTSILTKYFDKKGLWFYPKNDSISNRFFSSKLYFSFLSRNISSFNCLIVYKNKKMSNCCVEYYRNDDYLWQVKYYINNKLFITVNDLIF